MGLILAEVGHKPEVGRPEIWQQTLHMDQECHPSLDFLAEMDFDSGVYLIYQSEGKDKVFMDGTAQTF